MSGKLTPKTPTQKMNSHRKNHQYSERLARPRKLQYFSTRQIRSACKAWNFRRVGIADRGADDLALRADRIGVVGVGVRVFGDVGVDLGAALGAESAAGNVASALGAVGHCYLLKRSRVNKQGGQCEKFQRGLPTLMASLIRSKDRSAAQNWRRARSTSSKARVRICSVPLCPASKEPR